MNLKDTAKTVAVKTALSYLDKDPETNLSKLMDPTSACNLKCTGCWAAEYGKHMNLTYEEMDDVEKVSGQRCDGFSSSVFNCIIAMASGLALCIFNYGITFLGYQAPTAAFVPVQNAGVQRFMIFCVIGVQAVAYPVIIGLLAFFRNDRHSMAAANQS